MRAWLGLRLLDCEHCLLHRTRYSSFSHTLLHLDYRAPHCDPSIQSISTKSEAMHVPASCWERGSRSACWGTTEFFRSYCCGGACYISVSSQDCKLGSYDVCVHMLLQTIPASCVLGSSWADWRRIFAQTKPKGSIEYLICLPAHGAVIGAWFGAWPMPLDWERPWQEWPISVSYGTVAGYLVALVASLGFVLACGRSQHIKRE
ncbi:GPI biosynthesis protein family Pig-F isoform X2 [Glycine max]|uniref:GPI biosynthesis protein family Pig-F isoform X2 n=1 Tax=Glycine max TaxID=3847 RepID=UPI001B354868|nr:GPI biosynthesis protein family Pig-F isoform X2 [Glycine max]